MNHTDEIYKILFYFLFLYVHSKFPFANLTKCKIVQINFNELYWKIFKLNYQTKQTLNLEKNYFGFISNFIM